MIGRVLTVLWSWPDGRLGVGMVPCPLYLVADQSVPDYLLQVVCRTVGWAEDHMLVRRGFVW